MLISSKKVLCLVISALTAFSVCLTGCGKDTQSSVSATEKTTAVATSQPVTKSATSDEQTQEPTWNYSELKRKSSDISENLDAIITDNKFRGTVYVKIGNALEYIGTNGFSDKDRHTKNSTDTCFRIASLTKQFTAVAVMQLVEEGKLSLDDTIDKYFPSYKYGKKITGPDELVFHFSDEQTGQILYAQELVDAVWPLSEEEMAARITADETWQADPVLETYSVLFNWSRLEEDGIRRALSLAIDRDAIAALAGITGKPAAGLVPPGVPEGEQDFRTSGGDLIDMTSEGYADRCTQAVRLMQEAGYDRGSDLGTLEYLYADEGTNGAVAEALCRMWRSVLGLNITPRGVTKAELMTALRSGSYTLAGMAVSAVCNDAECFLMDWTSGNSDNLLHYENSAFDTLMSIIAKAEEGSARMGCLHDAEDLLLEIDCALAPIYTAGTAWDLRETYRGGFRDPRGWFDFRGVYLRPVTVQ